MAVLMPVRSIEVPEHIAHEASMGLWERDPLLSARTVLTRPQGIGLVVAAVLYVIALVAAWRPTVIVTLLVVSVLFLIATAFKFHVSLAGARYDLADRIDPAELAALTDEELPTYTVLVPVFREANIVHQLVTNLGALDYRPTSSRS
ncbi:MULTISPECIES: hypothetical protein [Miniimonas]|uniref:hypothetical protein n=1 Tax=Miniimonas TaxID=947525 RepID=UPI001F242E7A|nr:MULTISPECIES: hypothetical protein [Miniimonas]